MYSFFVRLTGTIRASTSKPTVTGTLVRPDQISTCSIIVTIISTARTLIYVCGIKGVYKIKLSQIKPEDTF